MGRRGDPLTVHGDGRQSRSFCGVDDMVERLVRPLRAQSQQPAARGQPPDEPRRRRPDIVRARSRLGWELNDGLRETIDHFRHLLGRPARHVSLVPDVAVVRLGSNG